MRPMIPVMLLVAVVAWQCGDGSTDATRSGNDVVDDGGGLVGEEELSGDALLDAQCKASAPANIVDPPYWGACCNRTFGSFSCGCNEGDSHTIFPPCDPPECGDSGTLAKSTNCGFDEAQYCCAGNP